ncbi:MAG TPA: DNA-binding protein [Desulfobacterales bacterium]|nr:DNA-binding protein [Desulfobacterales bacterium]
MGLPEPRNFQELIEPDLEDLLKASDVAKIFRCSRALIYRMADRGQLPCVRWPCPGMGKRKTRETVRFKKAVVIAFLEKHEKG